MLSSSSPLSFLLSFSSLLSSLLSSSSPLSSSLSFSSLLSSLLSFSSPLSSLLFFFFSQPLLLLMLSADIHDERFHLHFQIVLLHLLLQSNKKMVPILHVTIFRMFDWKSLLLFCHILICLKTLWKILHNSTFLTLLSPIVWKIWFICNILLIFFISRLPIHLLFFKVLSLYIPLILTIFLQSVLIFIWRQQFYLQFELFLNALIAQIKIGASFRSAFKTALSILSHSPFQNYFMEILEMILFSKNLRKEFHFSPLQQMIEELRKADQSSHCLEHLENLRHQIRVRSIFQKKVQSTLLQIRIQSFVLLSLYSGLFIFVLHRYGLKYIKVMFLSSVLFISGLIFLFQCGKKIKWTI